jgi:hypothetical protein
VPTLSKSEQEAARIALPTTSQSEGAEGGVFSHEIHVADGGEHAKEHSA